MKIRILLLFPWFSIFLVSVCAFEEVWTYSHLCRVALYEGTLHQSESSEILGRPFGILCVVFMLESLVILSYNVGSQNCFLDPLVRIQIDCLYRLCQYSVLTEVALNFSPQRILGVDLGLLCPYGETRPESTTHKLRLYVGLLLHIGADLMFKAMMFSTFRGLGPIAPMDAWAYSLSL